MDIETKTKDKVTYLEVRCQIDAHPKGWPTRIAKLLDGKLIGVTPYYPYEVDQADQADQKYIRMNAGCVYALDDNSQLYWDNGSPRDPNLNWQ